MKKFALSLLYVLFILSFAVLLSSFAFGQRNNIDTFSVADTHEFDTVNLITLTPSWNFPGQSKNVGALPGSWNISAPGGCYIVTDASSHQYWTCAQGWFSGAITCCITRLMWENQPMMGWSVNSKQTNYMMGMTSCIRWDIYGIYDADGTSHPYSGNPALSLYSPVACGSTQTGTLTTIDNTGLTATYSSTTGSLKATAAYDTSGNNAGADVFGNTQTLTGTPTVFTDTLGAATTFGTNGTNNQDAGDPTQYQYTDTTGTTQDINLTVGSGQSFIPRGSSSCVNYPSTPFTMHPVTKIAYPDGTSFGITWDTNGTGLSGLIGSVTLRTGGSITYTYGSIASGCGPLEFTSLTRATADGNTTYSTSISGTTQTTTVKDPGLNKTVYTFYVPSGTLNSFITLIDRYQNTGTVGSPTYTQISETKYCYNNPTTCSTQTPSYPITQLDTYQYTYNGATQVAMSHDVKLYDSTYGLLTSDAATDSINSQTITKTIVYGTWNGTSCAAITNTKIVDHPCTITTKNGTTQLALETLTYNANGAVTADANWVSSTDTLTTNYTRNSTGTPATITLPNSQVITNTFGSCNSLMLTDSTTTINSVAIDNKTTWNCNGGLVNDTTDPNGNEDDYSYDSMNRLSSYTDRLENVTSYAYGTPTLDHVKVTDPQSVVSYVYNDGLGRPTNKQVCQSSGCSNLDTFSKSYAWNGTNFETTTYVPCVKTTLNSACTTVSLTADSNPVFGPVKTTDANSGTLTWARNSKDFSLTAGPAPTQENTKVVQTEVDGFGRTTSTCALEASGGTTCGQTMGNSGILSSNTYSFGTGTATVATARGSQTHTTIADSLGRVTSIAIPESGTVTNVYDKISAANGCHAANATSPGDLMQYNLADGTNNVCYVYDGVRRLIETVPTNFGTTSPCILLRYDTTSNAVQTAPSDYPASGANLVGRLVEAETNDCTNLSTGANVLTDEWFAYDKLGHITDMWESTPNSGGFYHTSAGYDSDGRMYTLSKPSGWSFSFGGDNEDRYNSMSYTNGTTTTIVAGSGFSYDAASRPTAVQVGTNSADQDTFSYDNVGNMTDFKFAVNSKTFEGALTFNSIGSLNKLVITDGFNSGGSQTCTYGTSTVEGYDDVGRLLDANCGSLIQHDSWTYDQYDNATRTSNPGTNWNPGYSSTTNHMTGSSYDTGGNGNLTYDGNSSYSWNTLGQMVGTVSGNHTISCGTSGHVCSTYDAFGRIVEVNNGGTKSQVLFSPIGKIAYMSGSTLNNFYVPAPGGGAFYTSGSNMYFLHPDWLRTKRLSTNLSTRAYQYDTAFTPYGESYDTFGTLVPDFTGLTQDVASGLFTTPTRTLATNSSRWPSPDPAHASWNAYSYPTDPNTQTDPSGLQTVQEEQLFPLANNADWLWASSGQYRAGGLWYERTGIDIAVGYNAGVLGSYNPPIASTYTLPAEDYALSAGADWSGGHASRPSDPLMRIISLMDSGLFGGDPSEYDTGNLHGEELMKVAGVGGEWTPPGFTVVRGFSPKLASIVSEFADDNPHLIAAETGDCWPSCMALSHRLRAAGIGNEVKWLNAGVGYSGAKASMRLSYLNPQFEYTNGISHTVVITDDGWVIDPSARQFDMSLPFPYIFKLLGVN